MKTRRVDYLNSLPWHKQLLEALKIALNFKFRIRNFKEYLEEEIEVKE